jgi:hypothetical protein
MECWSRGALDSVSSGVLDMECLEFCPVRFLHCSRGEVETLLNRSPDFFA